VRNQFQLSNKPNWTLKAKNKIPTNWVHKSSWRVFCLSLWCLRFTIWQWPCASSNIHLNAIFSWSLIAKKMNLFNTLTAVACLSSTAWSKALHWDRDIKRTPSSGYVDIQFDGQVKNTFFTSLLPLFQLHLWQPWTPGSHKIHKKWFPVKCLKWLTSLDTKERKFILLLLNINSVFFSIPQKNHFNF